MKKEVIIAVISGLVLGLIITLGIYTANKSLSKLKTQKKIDAQTENLPSPTLAQTNKILSVTSAEPFDLINQSDLTLSGVAWPQAIVALMTETNNLLTQADSEGIFSFQFDLINGFNEITIIATDETSETQTLNLILTYSTSKIELEDEPVSFSLVSSAYAQEDEEASQSSLTEKIKERLQDKNLEIDSLQTKTPKKKAYLGVIKSINDKEITVEYKAKSQKLSVIDNTEVIESKGKVKLDLEDLEVDDFILSLGFIFPDSEALQAHKILRLKEPEPAPARQLITGRIEELDGNKVVVDRKRITIGSKTSLDIKDIEKPTIEDLELDDNLYAIVTLDKNGDIDIVRNILVIPGKNNPAALEPTNQKEATDSAETPESDTIEE
jgi:hypothetical protein